LRPATRKPQLVVAFSAMRNVLLVVSSQQNGDGHGVADNLIKSHVRDHLIMRIPRMGVNWNEYYIISTVKGAMD
jgi:hypothetical protein